MSSFRPGFRLFQATRNIFRQQTLRRRVQTAAENPTQKTQSGFAKYWNSPVGPKTVHFWAPVMKWGLVLAGVSDFWRPAESLSLSQNAALMATGAIWTRWCLIIKPRNVLLATVNFFLGCVGVVQVTRILLWRRSQKGTTLTDELKDVAKEEGAAVKQVVQDPKGAVENAEVKSRI